MDEKPKPREDAYVKHLAKLVGEPARGLGANSNKPVFPRSPQPPQKKSSARWLYIGGVTAVALLILLMVRSVLAPRTDFDGTAAEFAQAQYDAEQWALSSAKGMMLTHLRDPAASFPLDTVDSKYAGDNRWRVWGSVDSLNRPVTEARTSWEIEVEYLHETKSGQIVKVTLGDGLIYSK